MRPLHSSLRLPCSRYWGHDGYDYDKWLKHGSSTFFDCQIGDLDRNLVISASWDCFRWSLRSTFVLILRGILGRWTFQWTDCCWIVSCLYFVSLYIMQLTNLSLCKQNNWRSKFKSIFNNNILVIIMYSYIELTSDLPFYCKKKHIVPLRHL